MKLKRSVARLVLAVAVVAAGIGAAPTPAEAGRPIYSSFTVVHPRTGRVFHNSWSMGHGGYRQYNAWGSGGYYYSGGVGWHGRR